MTARFALAVAAALLLAPAPAAAQEAASADKTLSEITGSAAFRKAAAAIEQSHDQWIAETIAITEIPAPPFKEKARGDAFKEMLRKRGLSNVETDAEGNVLALRKGTAGGPVVVVSAHLDTVFPEGTNVKVRREGNKLHAPGIGDDSAGLATMLALIDAMNAAGVTTRSDILFVGTVGEEGLGDLRGVRHLFTAGKYKGRVKAFFSIDGEGLDEITTQGTGSKRYRITFKGPGGHSYSAFGIVNPMAALGRTVVDMYALKVPAAPKTTFSASVVGGGTSVNAIPDEVWLEVDMRSESAAELAKLEQQFLDIVTRSVDAENAARSTAPGKITAERKKIGDRPAGQTAQSADIVRFATQAFAGEGITLRYTASSTDSNVPMSLGIPSITVSGNALGGRAHALDEWMATDREPNLKLKRAVLATILATAGTR